MTEKTREQIASDIASEWPDNTSGDITPAKLRTVVTNLADSALWHDEAPEGGGDVTGTSETTDGHAVVFDGSTGKAIKSAGAAPVLEGDSRLTDARTPTSHGHVLDDISDAGDAAALDVGTTAGTVAAGDHNHSGVYQPADADLDAIAGLATTDGNVIVGNGATWVAESGGTARTSLGLGTGDSPQFTAINIGHASDTTLARAAAGRATIEGAEIVRSSTTQGGSGAAVIQNVVGITQTAFDLLDPPDANTFYVITGE